MTLEIKDQEHYDKVVAFAQSVGAEAQLRERLDYLGTFATLTECELYYDFAPHSFGFVMFQRQKTGSERTRWFNGSLIYSGPGVPSNGSFPSLTVSIDRDAASGARHMWSVHT
jgi:hypothetical protein